MTRTDWCATSMSDPIGVVLLAYNAESNAIESFKPPLETTADRTENNGLFARLPLKICYRDTISVGF